ncbi:hypothetical protein SS50377_20647 [Spironucleus salmonicida]|uniref:Uncharacterized protein n=1 Tax=Spironucleus salmonicida TaxID=348837 RepID=A0A9P8S216_9EUKA|nr:hypothetical protein SS50377_20647 [Spironucleus salmonicida]
MGKQRSRQHGHNSITMTEVQYTILVVGCIHLKIQTAIPQMTSFIKFQHQANKMKILLKTKTLNQNINFQYIRYDIIIIQQNSLILYIFIVNNIYSQALLPQKFTQKVNQTLQ